MLTEYRKTHSHPFVFTLFIAIGLAAMNTSRALAQAIWLQDGEVLVSRRPELSRTVKLNYLSSAELYTPQVQK